MELLDRVALARSSPMSTSIAVQARTSRPLAFSAASKTVPGHLQRHESLSAGRQPHQR